MVIQGPKGSGKTYLAHELISRLGPAMLANIRLQSNLEIALAYNNLLILDNVDSLPQWAYDPILLSLQHGSLIKRKLYTKDETVELPLRAAVALTTIKPISLRADLADRITNLILPERIPV